MSKTKTRCERCQCKNCKERKKLAEQSIEMMLKWEVHKIIMDTLYPKEKNELSEPKTFNEIYKKKPSKKMVNCKGCYYKIMPFNKTGYCYRCRRKKR